MSFSSSVLADSVLNPSHGPGPIQSDDECFRELIDMRVHYRVSVYVE